MQTTTTCSLNDDYKHVCFKDLENYLKKDSLLSGYSSLEQEKIRQNLGITNWDQVEFDPKLSIYSENAVKNKVITEALSKKIDINKLADVAITGNYKDLLNKPCQLPNPEILLFKGGLDAKNTVYDGSENVIVNLPSKVSDFPDAEDFKPNYATIESMIPIKQISVNDVILKISTDKIANIIVPTKISQLTNDSSFVTQPTFESVIDSLKVDINNANTNSSKAVFSIKYENNKIIFYDADNKELYSIDTTPFIKDGMIESVDIVDNNLSFTFNKDSGKENINVALDKINKIESDRAIDAETNINNSITAEISRATTKENTLQENIDSENARALTKETSLSNDIVTEQQRAEDAESTLNSAITTEKTRATTAEKTNADAITKEITDRTAADKTNSDAITAETTRAQAAEKVNADAITVINGTGEGSITKKVADGISSVVANAPASLDTLKEIADWINSDSTGVAAMQSSITTLTTNLTNEVTRAKAAESTNAGNITTLTSEKASKVSVNGTTYTASNGLITLPNYPSVTDTSAANLTGVVAIVNGGTGASTIADARTNLGLSTVANTGLYSDLLNKPALAEVATTGDYKDLINRPTTLADSGLTDIKISNGTITIGTNTITPITSLSTVQPTLVSGTNIKTINGNSLLGSGNITIDSAPDLSSYATKTYVDNSDTTLQTNINKKQDTLVSATNIKTINGTSILGTGDLAIATYNPANYYWADVAISSIKNTTSSPTFASATITGNLSAQNGNFTVTSDGAFWSSDKNLKHNIKNISETFTKNLFANNYFKTFTWNETDKASAGVIAQEIEEIIPEAVVTKEDGFKSVNYQVVLSKVSGAMINKIKSQQNEINELKAQILEIKNLINK